LLTGPWVSPQGLVLISKHTISKGEIVNLFF
jgi:hypothetical protein